MPVASSQNRIWIAIGSTSAEESKMSFDTVFLKRIHAVLAELATRRVHVAGVTADPTRRVGGPAGAEAGLGSRRAIRRVRFLLRDRDGKFIAALDTVFTAAGIEVIGTLPQAPRANAFAGRLAGNVRRECTDRRLIAGERYLAAILTEYTSNPSRLSSPIGADELSEP
jgi:putative transposase